MKNEWKKKKKNCLLVSFFSFTYFSWLTGQRRFCSDIQKQQTKCENFFCSPDCKIYLIWRIISTTFKLLLWFLFTPIQNLPPCIPLFLFVFIKITLGARDSVLPRISYLYYMRIFLTRYLFSFLSAWDSRKFQGEN